MNIPCRSYLRIENAPIWAILSNNDKLKGCFFPAKCANT